MSKKILALLLAAAMMSAALASCGGNTDDGEDTTAGDTTVEEATEAPAASVSVSDLKEAVLGAYGDLYNPESEMGMPLMDIDPDTLANVFGINAEWVDEYAAGMPMMITNVDTFIIVKPSEGNADNVLTALNSYYDYLVNDSMQYPKDLEKVRAAKVFTKGDYVFFIMLGMLSDDALYAEGTEEEIAAIQFDEATANNQKAIDAIDALLG